MLAKKFRLPAQFFVKKTGRISKKRFFLLKEFSPQKAYGRAGVVISRRVSPKATRRNYLKRVILDFFRANLKNLPIKDFLLILLPEAGKLDKREILQELNKLTNN